MSTQISPNQPTGNKPNRRIAAKNPAAIEARIASFDISRRRWDEQIEPLIWAVGTLLLVPGLSTNAGRYPHGVALPLGVLSLALFFWDGRRIWGWRLEMLPDRLRVRRGFCWSTIPWEQILTVESVGRGNQERVVVKLTSHSEYLGTFNCAFARNLRDRLRIEIAERQGKATVGRFIPHHAITGATLGADHAPPDDWRYFRQRNHRSSCT
jgi:hypothetical protein